MNIESKSEIREIILKDLLSIRDRRVILSKQLNENLENNLAYLRALVTELSQPSSGPLVMKTPKILRKRAVQRIETIPEDEIFQQKDTSSASFPQSVNEEEQKASEIMSGRPLRNASKRAADNIKKQYSFNLSENDNVPAKKTKRESRAKRKKSAASSSDEEDGKSNSKYSKLDEDLVETKRSTRRVTRKKSEQVAQSIVHIEEIKESEKTDAKDTSNLQLLQRHSSRSKSKNSQDREVSKIDGAITELNADDIEEPSMYEDAIGKPTPIMNSTAKHSSDLPEKVLNATVILERLPQQHKLNETVVIQKTSSMEKSNEKNTKKLPQDSMQLHKENTQYNDCNGLITEDESSPEIKKSKKQLSKKPTKKKTRRISSSDDEIPNTPVKTYFRDAIIPAVAHESKTTYKSNALFSPYAKESVKKRVEAFEQAVCSPKPIDVDAPIRVTRTKTRAMIAANTETEPKNEEKNVAQILARKSLAKAKKISLAREKKDNEEFKEVKTSANKERMPEQINKLTLNDKPNTKQQKTTPLSKTKMMQPVLSINRLHTPSNTQNLLNHQKTVTGSRANIIISMDSFIQPPKSISKANSVEKLEDKKRYEEDVRKKREEGLRLQTEEKRRKRKEKELKNKLAREAKEKQELEKRQKAEREKEEKAKLALLMLEKQREELEKKRLAQLQRMQEKEERRKLEEQQRLQRLQEQEETERLLAEQRRREQEAEKRKEAEMRAQQAAAEALKQKNLMLAAQAKNKQQANNKPQCATNYILDSEPDDDESDDENRPKHEIPYWAQAQVRRAQLAMQRYIPQELVFKFFDTRKCTPDLTELFHGIDRSRLKRTSSAIWKTPPRMSMMEAD